LIIALLSLTPVLLVLLAIKAYPMALTVFRGFTNWDGLYRENWVGLHNYLQIFSSDTFWVLLRNSLVLLISVPLQVVLGLIVAVLLYEQTAGWKLFRSVFYLPQIMAPVIIGYLFRVFFSMDGPVNQFLSVFSVQPLTFEWLSDTWTALGVLVLSLTWFSVGWQAIVILAGMSQIPPSVFEAAQLDGAGYWQRTFKIVLPMLGPTIEYCVVMSTVWTMTSLFPFVYSMTRGGPGYETTTFDYMIYIRAFQSGGNLGVACAYAVILLVIIGGITLLQMRLSRDSAEKSGL
jgi:ABC-type sugar transport system permease subunit